MQRSGTAMLFVIVLFAVGCDSKAPVTAQPSTDSGLPPSKEPQVVSASGVLEEAGISIVMQGSHKLVESGSTVCYLQSKKVDLGKYLGKRVTVSGQPGVTTEGGQTIIDVQAITTAPAVAPAK